MDVYVICSANAVNGGVWYFSAVLLSGFKIRLLDWSVYEKVQ